MKSFVKSVYIEKQKNPKMNFIAGKQHTNIPENYHQHQRNGN